MNDYLMGDDMKTTFEEAQELPMIHCPFCCDDMCLFLRHNETELGSQAQYWVRCISCEVDGPKAEYPKEAVDYWNTRDC
jgi:hypothetical protein